MYGVAVVVGTRVAGGGQVRMLVLKSIRMLLSRNSTRPPKHMRGAEAVYGVAVVVGTRVAGGGQVRVLVLKYIRMLLSCHSTGPP